MEKFDSYDKDCVLNSTNHTIFSSLYCIGTEIVFDLKWESLKAYYIFCFLYTVECVYYFTTMICFTYNFIYSLPVF